MTAYLSPLQVFIALVTTASILAGGLFLAAQTLTQNTAFNDKSAAVQGCLEVAKGTSVTTGTSASSAWTVTEATVNEKILSMCLDQKGY